MLDQIAMFVAMFFVILGVVEILVRVLFGVSVNHFLSYTIYTIILILIRIVKAITRGVTEIVIALKKTNQPDRRTSERPRQIPLLVSQWPRFFKLKPGEIVVGLDRRRRAIKMPITGVHTLVSGLTGSGKSVFLHSVLSQCISMGEYFLSQHALFVLDLKGDLDDSFDVWEPVLEGYFRIGRDGVGIEGAIDMMRTIHGRISNPSDRRKSIVLIDEIGSLSTREAGQIFNALCSQLRSTGGIIATTQTAHYTVVETKSRNNFWQRVCFPVSDVEHARLALAVKPNKNDLPRSEGEFIARIKSRDLETGKSPLPRSSEAEEIVNNVIESMSQRDERIRMYMEATRGLDRGNALPGIKGISDEVEWINRARLNNLYRNLDEAGIALYNRPGKKGGRFIMQVDYKRGLAMFREHLKENWSEDVAPVAEAA